MLDRLGRPPSVPVIIPAGHRLSTATEQGRHRDGPVASSPEALMISALALSSRLDELSMFLFCSIVNRKG
jgi:hypothetical protein